MEKLPPNQIVKFSWMFRWVIFVTSQYYHRVFETDCLIQELMVIPAIEIFSQAQCSMVGSEIQDKIIVTQKLL